MYLKTLKVQTDLVASEVRGVIGRIDNILDTLVKRPICRIVEALHIAFAAPAL